METTYNNKYQLWSPPTLDLSLDSFSNDLFQEFDKTRSSISVSNKHENDNSSSIMIEEEDQNNRYSLGAALDDANSITLPQQEQLEDTDDPQVSELQTKQENDAQESIPTAAPQENTVTTSSSVTLPTSDQGEQVSKLYQDAEAEEAAELEDTSSATNLFRQSSTFLKKKLSLNSRRRDENQLHSNRNSISTTSAEEITNIVSRQYPPKPLQYSPVIEPRSDNESVLMQQQQQQIGNTANENDKKSEKETFSIKEQDANKNGTLPRNIVVRAVAVATTKESIDTQQQQQQQKSISTTKRMSDPTITVAVPPATTPTQPKRRSFFSLRFC